MQKLNFPSQSPKAPTSDTFYIWYILHPIDFTLWDVMQNLNLPAPVTKSFDIQSLHHPLPRTPLSNLRDATVSIFVQFFTSQNLNHRIWIRIEHKLGLYFSKLLKSLMDNHIWSANDRQKGQSKSLQWIQETAVLKVNVWQLFFFSWTQKPNSRVGMYRNVGTVFGKHGDGLSQVEYWQEPN